ncbi:uncharacterized protein F5147DRAFT_570026 [Suillus discolor]|uniref:C3H1-type domain-containing protein n=1 Tax=Suillus discolor TaxID=1912936 RepID=A0A9P7JY38_9AGAM|nr:uncharacterized protein F5147DRAFT_570026 [Suillus discolor]KAG2114600.1 hypothetical protein F5147DRAFT_570026 [Suillus discolor]
MAGNTPQTSSNGLDLSQQVLATACIAVVNNYRRSHVTKLEAIIMLVETISGELFATPGRVSTVTGPYLAMLDEVESELARATDSSTRGRTTHSDEPAPVDEEAPLPEDRSRAGSVEPGEPARKRSKLDYSSIDAAVKCRKFQPLSPSLEQTNEILKNWSQDPKEVQRYLMYHKFGPEFHKSGWTEIIAGECINLDVVHTIITSSHTVDKQTEVLGGMEIKYGVLEAASKKIATDSDWYAAWNKSADAVKFAFPHREAELNGYFAFISKYFSQANPSAHGRVIRFNKAVRNRVGSSCRLELTNFREFEDLIFSHFNADGRQRNDPMDTKSSSGSSPSTSNKHDPCQKWNTGECSRSAASCRYAHVCSFEQDGRTCGRRHTKTKHHKDSKPKST